MIKNLNNYQSKLSWKETELAIKYIKDNFENDLANKLNLMRVSAPLFLTKQSGLNDGLNGVEQPVSFFSNNIEIEIIHSLAKWKRNALKEHNIELNKGIYSDMNAIRKDEDLDNIHSLYVDQWDWEKRIDINNRNLDYLFSVVKDIYSIIKEMEIKTNLRFKGLQEKLPKNISFISTEDLEAMYPELTRKERENKIAKKTKAVFIYKIGWPLKDGKPHDGRASDYDDWDLNGDIIVYNSILDSALELSSMGIRVDKNSIMKQINYKKDFSKIATPYVQNIIKEYLPYSIGGGIGQSRLCMFLLEKAHIGEVQSSYWNDEDKTSLENMNIHLL